MTGLSTRPARAKSRLAGRLLAALLSGMVCAATAAAQGGVEKKTRTLRLGETEVKVNLYEKDGRRVTFFAPHHDERGGAEAAREFVTKYGGRLVEVVSYDGGGRPARRLGFTSRGKGYSLDPNRIYTEDGRRCAVAPEVLPAAESFAAALLEIIFAPGGKRLRDGEGFVVAVHNNADFEGRAGRARADDLTADAFARPGPADTAARGAFQEQAAGVYLSNREADADNFVFVTAPRLVGLFAERGFNVVLQKSAEGLRGGGCGVDDGSLSVYAALQGIAYVNLEADAATGGARQREMLEAVYDLLAPGPAAEPLK